LLPNSGLGDLIVGFLHLTIVHTHLNTQNYTHNLRRTIRHTKTLE